MIIESKNKNNVIKNRDKQKQKDKWNDTKEISRQNKCRIFSPEVLYVL